MHNARWCRSVRGRLRHPQAGQPDMSSVRRWQKYFEDCKTASRTSQPFTISGRLTRVAGLVMEAVGLKLPVGNGCYILTPSGQRVDAEVVGFSGERLFLMPSSRSGPELAGARGRWRGTSSRRSRRVDPRSIYAIAQPPGESARSGAYPHSAGCGGPLHQCAADRGSRPTSRTLFWERCGQERAAGNDGALHQRGYRGSRADRRTRP